MLDLGKREILGVMVNGIDYEAAVAQIVQAATSRRALGVAALAVHGVLTGTLDKEQRYRLNALDLALPDGQPVRWALRYLHGVRLPDRVYGPNLVLRVCAAAAESGLPVYLYGSRNEVLDRLRHNLQQRFQTLEIAGQQASAFGQIDQRKKAEIVRAIRESGAAIVLVGLGCPRQEVWVFEHLRHLDMPLLAVGAAFDFHAGLLPQAPRAMQDRGLEWLYRLFQEPRRLWRRYLLLNTLYVVLISLQMLGIRTCPASGAREPKGELRYG